MGKKFIKKTQRLPQCSTCIHRSFDTCQLLRAEFSSKTPSNGKCTCYKKTNRPPIF